MQLRSLESQAAAEASFRRAGTGLPRCLMDGAARGNRRDFPLARMKRPRQVCTPAIPMRRSTAMSPILQKRSWLAQDVVRVDMILPMRIGALIFGCLFAGLGVALYMAAGMGTAPYDSTAVVLEKITRGRLPFQYARVCTDATAVAVGIIFCLAAENSLWQIVGIGTICNACLNGPLIQFFRSHICEPLLTGKK